MSGTEKMLLLIAVPGAGHGILEPCPHEPEVEAGPDAVLQVGSGRCPPLLWVVTVGCLVLAFYCVYKGLHRRPPRIGIMVGLPGPPTE